MKQYDIKIVDKAFSWEEVPVLDIDCIYPGNPDAIFAYAQICCDENCIKVHMWTTEPERRAVEKGPLGTPCEDSCLEFFFCPIKGDDRYFNIEVNSNGSVFLGMGSNIDNLIRLITPENESLITTKIQKDENGWELFYDIPFDFIRRIFPGFKIQENMEIKANCYKCSDLGKYPHYLSWSPIVGEPFRFHRPECFGTMKFAK